MFLTVFVGGFDAEDSREMVIRLEAAGVDLIELSGGTYECLVFSHMKESTKKREAFFIECVWLLRHSGRCSLSNIARLDLPRGSVPT